MRPKAGPTLVKRPNGPVLQSSMGMGRKRSQLMHEVISVREFASGAVRDGDAEKADYEGFLSPLVLERFGRYMHEHRRMADGTIRASDNWQRGIPLDAYMK